MDRGFRTADRDWGGEGMREGEGTQSYTEKHRDTQRRLENGRRLRVSLDFLCVALCNRFSGRPGLWWLATLLVVAILFVGCAGQLPARRPPISTTPQPLTIAAGFSATPIVTGLEGPTQMIAGPDGRLWVAQLAGAENAGTGQVLAIDLATGEREVLLDRLVKPTGIAVLTGDLWIASGADLLRAPIAADGTVGPPVPVLVDLPTNGRSNGTLTATPHGEIIFETSGSRLGNEPAPGSARLWALTPQDPTHPRELAGGLKNAYGHVVDAQGRVWTTENRRRSHRRGPAARRVEPGDARRGLRLAPVRGLPGAGARATAARPSAAPPRGRRLPFSRPAPLPPVWRLAVGRRIPCSWPCGCRARSCG